MNEPRVYLIDSSIYIFRAWHIFDTGIRDSEGQAANAVFGFGDFLYHLLRQKRPQHIACAFDFSQTDSWRKELYPAYKANREPAPQELRRQFDLCRAFCRAIGIAEFGSTRYEADDIIGSLARKYRERGFAITVVSADKDLTQLITGEQDQWWDFARSNLLDAKGIKQQFGVLPHLIADMLAISGDKVDNIKGVPGIGYSTAARILQKFDGIDSVLANLAQVGAMKFRGAARAQAQLRSHAHLLPLNKQLTTVYTQMEFPHDLDLAWRGVDPASLAELSARLALGQALQQRWHRLQDQEPG
jgi:5'-3' exonuclease